MIAAPPQTVWETLTEFPAYGSWHPVLLIDDAPAAPGTRLSGRITGGYTGERDFSAEILEADGPHRLVWEGGIPGVLTGRHIFQLDPTGDGGTRYIESETWSGSAAEETYTRAHEEIRGQYAQNAAALKAWVESRLR